MCGIAGVAGDCNERLVADMLKRIHHRGPDDQGTYASSAGSDGGVALGNVRLSILDLSPAGHQPMCNEDGSVWVAYNGEIYNFPELREELLRDGHTLKSHTDTEILPHLYEKYGTGMVNMLNGMFTFALWDGAERKLFIARDRCGIKPLYYTESAGRVYFASEVKALLACRDICAELNTAVLQQYLAFMYVPGPDTLFKNIFKLDPGHALVWQDGKLKIWQYWDAIPGNYSRTSPRELAEELRTILVRATKRQMISDVPVGFFLSGGLDSSTILACAARANSGPLRCYTIAFAEEDGRLEASSGDSYFARMIAKQFGAEYNEIRVDPDVVDLLPKVIWHLDDAISCDAAITTYLISDAARDQVKVLLSGQGGDEVFGGYPVHLMPKLAGAIRLLPGPLRRRFSANMIDSIAHASVQAGARPGTAIVYSRYVQRLIAMADLPARDRYIRARSYVYGQDLSVLLSPELRSELAFCNYASRFEQHFDSVSNCDFIDQMLYVDYHTFLVDLNLAYSDKLTMARSIEARVPLLDNEVIEFMLRVPPQMKIRGLNQKWLLKEAMRPWLPSSLIDRRKAGFGLPVRSWLRGKLREMVGDLLSESAIYQRGLLNPVEVSRIVRENQAGERDHTHRIWSLLTLEIWLRQLIDQNDAIVPAPSLSSNWNPGMRVSTLS